MTFFTKPTLPGTYNNSPPDDSGNETPTNEVLWATIKAKLSDPLVSWVNSILTEIDKSFLKRFLGNSSTVSISSNIASGDEGKLIVVDTSGVTMTLPKATDVGAGYMVVVKNISVGDITLATQNNELIDGTDTSITLVPDQITAIMSTGTAWLIGYSSVAEVATFITGDLTTSSRTSKPGWLLMNGDRIGDTGTAGADQAGAANLALFTHLWNTLGDSAAPVLDIDTNKKNFTVTITSDDQNVALTAHGYSNNDVVIVFNTGGSLPGGLESRRPYFVVGATANAFGLSLTLGGAPITFTSNGSGTHTVLKAVRGGSAAADWAADKTIMLPNMIDCAIIGAGARDGHTTRTLGVRYGTEDVMQTAAMTAPHYQHAGFADDHGGVTGEEILASSSTPDQRVWITSKQITSDNDYTGEGILAKFAFTTNQASSSTQINATGHNLENGDRVRLVTTGKLPLGLKSNQLYYVVNKAVNSFELSLTEGGGAVSFNDDGSGTHSAVIQGDTMLTSAAIVDETGTPISQIATPIMQPSVAWNTFIKL